MMKDGYLEPSLTRSGLAWPGCGDEYYLLFLGLTVRVSMFNYCNSEEGCRFYHSK